MRHNCFAEQIISNQVLKFDQNVWSLILRWIFSIKDVCSLRITCAWLHRSPEVARAVQRFVAPAAVFSYQHWEQISLENSWSKRFSPYMLELRLNTVPHYAWGAFSSFDQLIKVLKKIIGVKDYETEEPEEWEWWISISRYPPPLPKLYSITYHSKGCSKLVAIKVTCLQSNSDNLLKLFPRHRSENHFEIIMAPFFPMWDNKSGDISSLTF